MLLRFLGRFVFLLESTQNEYANERLPCNTMRIGENIADRSYGIATPHGSDLREAINIAVLELGQSGFFERLKQRWYYERSECTNIGTNDSKTVGPVNLINVVGIFYVLATGLGLGILIAIVEFLLKAKRDSNRLNQNIGKVMRRNLRISITGIGSAKKEDAVNYWPVQQQQHHTEPLQYRRNLKRDDQPPTTTTAMESLKSSDAPIVDEVATLDIDHTSHV